MNLKHAQYMITVLQEGSITGAAKKLYISQPSLSQMIKLAETNLGTPIFNRATDPLTLTYAGEKYMEAAQQILTINTNLTKEIEEINLEDHGKIRFGIPVQRAMQILPRVLPPFFKLYPHVDVDIFEQGSGLMENMVLDGTVDIACMTTTARHEDLRYILIENEELVLLAAKNTELAKRIPTGTPISITETANEMFVSNKPGHSIRAVQDNLFISNDIHPKIILETISIEVEKKVCLSCDAVMICPRSYIEDTKEMAESSSTYPILYTGGQRHCYLCHRKNLYITKYTRDFIDILTRF
ncbi:MAG: LysR family transcriptional regulator [Clostridium sp.]